MFGSTESRSKFLSQPLITHTRGNPSDWSDIISGNVVHHLDFGFLLLTLGAYITHKYGDLPSHRGSVHCICRQVSAVLGGQCSRTDAVCLMLCTGAPIATLLLLLTRFREARLLRAGCAECTRPAPVAFASFSQYGYVSLAKALHLAVPCGQRGAVSFV
jgi:hypothetical protein